MSSDADGEVLDGVVLHNLSALESLSGAELVAPIVVMFGRDGGSSLAAIRSGFQHDQRADLLSALHKLKGSAGNIGARRVAALCQELEAVAASGDHQEWESQVSRLARELEAANEALAELVAATAGGADCRPGP
jgi:HPt (histidine-containing phosphotransfer) domain-containing protein